MISRIETTDKKRLVQWLAGAAVCFGLFILLTVAVSAGRTQTLDETLAGHFYDLRTAGLTVLAKAVTVLGNWYSITVVCVILLIVPAVRREWGIPTAVVALITNMVRAIVKALVARPRPDIVYHLIEEHSSSFPSGHAVTSIAVYGLLACMMFQFGFKGHKAAGILCGLLAVVIGLTRIYLGVHYPCDVLGGWLAGLGILCLFGAYRQSRRGGSQ